jgi:hypothetical protein
MEQCLPNLTKEGERGRRCVVEKTEKGVVAMTGLLTFIWARRPQSKTPSSSPLVVGGYTLSINLGRH